MISKSLFNFLVTIDRERVTVQTGRPCGYKKEFCDRFAEFHEMIICLHLTRQNRKQDIYTSLLNYHAERQWSITEVYREENNYVI
ncbi:MAG: hypothetical protein JWQ09_2097 [Segetibacter sp.]|nr:hypothetical protein [Segetibacter sp.]